MPRTKRDQGLIDELTYKIQRLERRLQAREELLIWKGRYIEILEDKLGLDDDAIDDLRREAKTS